jgi:pimeloyl-ACP methyl ester carboxylesterase
MRSVAGSTHVRLAAATIVAAMLAAACSSASTAPPSGSSAAAAADGAPPRLAEVCSPTVGVTARPMWLRTSDGVQLYAIEAGTGATAVVLAEQGRSNLCGWLAYAKTLTAAGLRVLAFDFRGQGESAYPTSDSLALGRDLAAAAARVRADGAGRVVLMGASMGGAAVVQNSADIDADARVSLSGTRLWTGYGINEPAAVRRIHTPFLYVGSQGDSYAPLDEARSIFHAVGADQKRIVLYPGSTHGWDLVDATPRGERTRDLILRWIRRYT